MATKKPDAAGSNTRTGQPENHRPAEENARKEEPSAPAGSTPIVAIGASAGGLEALKEFFSHVPANTGIAFVVVTHIRPGRDTMLPELLGAVTKLQIIHAGESTKLEPDCIVVGRDELLRVSGGVVTPVQSEHEPIHHSIDYFFRTLADDQHEHAIGVILSGSGNDGTLGIRDIKSVGGMVMVQSPDSAKYTGMPDSAIATHLADFILPPRDMARALIDYCQGPYLRAVPRAEATLLPEAIVQAILMRLHAHSGHDFTCYKRSTISRRIQRRMTVHRIDEPQAYLGFIRDNPREMDALMDELLISVTSFFRDPEAWGALADKALPRLLHERDPRDPLRVWVPGCATGEEAYSVAIVMQELFQKAEPGLSAQIFATDLDERAIETARAGLYSEGISADVSPERLRNFFTREDGAYRINKNLRDQIVFAIQNVITDPPFMRLDLIVCRNLLIYLDADAQRRVLPSFHYALQPDGLLFLGSAEATGDAGSLFEPVDSRLKILRRRQTTRPFNLPLPRPARRAAPEPERAATEPRTSQPLSRSVSQLLLDRYVPCSVLVDDKGTVIFVHGRSGMFFEPEQGTQRNNVIEMAREGLATALGPAMRQARKEKREVTREGVRVRSNGGFSTVDLSVLPVNQPDALRGHLLLTLRTVASSREATSSGESKPATSAADSVELERELQRMRENLQTTVEELETSNEELKSSNEELQSTNEELQSTNEELETSKEELQSLNEELNTVNTELQAKVDALARSNDDMSNLLNSMHVATIFLDTRMRVKRYTDQARDVVRLISSDVGRPLSDLTSSLVYPALIDDCEGVLANLIPVEKEVRDTDGRWYLVRLIPYRTTENVIEGLVMTIVDIDRIKRTEASLRESLEERYGAEVALKTLLDQMPVAITIADAPDMTIRAVSRYLRELTGRRADTLVGIPLDKQGEAFDVYRSDGVTRPRPEELPLTRATLHGETVRGEAFQLGRRDGQQVKVLCSATPIRDAGGKIIGGVSVSLDRPEPPVRQEN